MIKRALKICDTLFIITEENGPRAFEKEYSLFLLDLKNQNWNDLKPIAGPLKNPEPLIVRMNSLIELMKIPIPNCPTCNSKMKIINGKYGPFFGCTRYPLCKKTLKINYVESTIKETKGTIQLFDELE